MFQRRLPPTPRASAAAGTVNEMDGVGETQRTWPGAALRAVTAHAADESGRGSSLR